MTQELVIHIAREALSLAVLLALPGLAVGLIVGLCISIVMATTQIQEQTLTFVPKIIAVFLAIFVASSWMLTNIIVFTTNLYNNIPMVIR